ncbi:AbiH family protein [Streptobacillus canis]|uniref:AbiH family protein n=1 Tax=Streptobacillus canis TaxID=2678686 RepID=UPI0012E13DC5|nr:AbiH family protein [Streptobacillus canis]
MNKIINYRLLNSKGVLIILNNKLKLLILGNGFDLSFNLKTSYSDFYNRTKKYNKEKEEVILKFFKFYIKEKMNIEEPNYDLSSIN